MLVLLAGGGLLAVNCLGFDSSALDPGPLDPDFDSWAVYPGRIMYAVGVTFTFQARLKDLPIMIIVCLITGGVTQGFTRVLGDIFGTFLGGITMTLFSVFFARKPDRAPIFVYILSAFFSLTPGSMGMRGFESLVGDQPIEGYTDFWDLIQTLIAIALGIVVGLAMTKPLGWRYNFET